MPTRCGSLLLARRATPAVQTRTGAFTATRTRALSRLPPMSAVPDRAKSKERNQKWTDRLSAEHAQRSTFASRVTTRLPQLSSSRSRSRTSGSFDEFALTRRGVQIALGLIWLLDGVLQFQSYFFTNSFLTGMITPLAAGQPGADRALDHLGGRGCLSPPDPVRHALRVRPGADRGRPALPAHRTRRARTVVLLGTSRVVVSARASG